MLHNTNRSGKNAEFYRLENYIKISFFSALFVSVVCATMIDSESVIPLVVLACSVTWTVSMIVHFLSIDRMIQCNIEDMVNEYLETEDAWESDMDEE